MEQDTGSYQQAPSSMKDSGKRSPIKYLLNVLIVLLFIPVVYFSYAFFSSDPSLPSTLRQGDASTVSRVIQLDVLNGSGAKGVAAKMTAFLRSHGFDVVEMKNYKSSHIPQTMVVDRIGDLTSAKRVAAALGISEKKVIQQINPDYFVDVSVIIGEDYTNLPSSH